MEDKSINRNMLLRWSRIIRLRDNGICYLCQKKEGIFKMHSHHIYPKSNPKYYDKIYILDNGITLCERCHKIVHATLQNWKKFCFMFKGHMRNKTIKKFNYTKGNKIE